MTTWVPRDYLPGTGISFGGWDAPPWGGPDEADPVLRAAGVQDQVARFVSRYLRENKVRQGDFSERIGIPRPKLNRIVNGAVWATLPELERLLGGCGSSMVAVSWTVGGGERQPEMIRRVIASYLHGQLSKVEGTART